MKGTQVLKTEVVGHV